MNRSEHIPPILIQPIGTDQASEINDLCTSAKTSQSLRYRLSVSTRLTHSCTQTNRFAQLSLLGHCLGFLVNSGLLQTLN